MSLLSGVGYWNSAYEGLQILQGLPNFVRFLRTLRLDPGRGPSTSAFFIDVFRPSSFPDLSPFRCQLPEPELLRLVGLPAVAFPTPVRLRPKPLRTRPFPSLSCVRSSSLSRPSPPGVYLKGSRIPIESPLDGTAVIRRAGLGDMLRTTGAFGSTFCPFPLAFRRVGRPAGGFH